MKKAALSLAKRESLKSGQFAVPAKKAKKLGVSDEIQGQAKGKYPVDTLKRARNALARVSQFGTTGEREAVRRKVYSKYPNLKSRFKGRHGGESPTSRRNVSKVEQGNISKTASIFYYFVKEMTKIAMKQPSLSILSRGSTFSSNAVTKPTTIKHKVMPLGGGSSVPQSSQAVSSLGVNQVGDIGGVNLRRPTTVDPKLPLTRGTPPASPVHVAPQVNPQAATVQQGAPQTVNSAAPTAGGAGVQQAPQAPAQSSGSQSATQRR